jgi:hypothetical protein
MQDKALEVMALGENRSDSTAPEIATDAASRHALKELTRRAVGLNMILGLGGLHGSRDLGGRFWDLPEQRPLATPVQASGLPSALFGEWVWPDQGTDGSTLYTQKVDLIINSDSSGTFIFTAQQSEIGGSGCTNTQVATIMGTWSVNGQALQLNGPMSTLEEVFGCAPGMNSTTHGPGLIIFHSFAVNGNTMVVTPPSALNLHELSASFGTPPLTSIRLQRIAGPSAPSTSTTTALFASVLPSSRSVQVGKPATAFATIINAGTSVATGCAIVPVTMIPANFVYQTTNPRTNALTGSPNTPVDIPGNNGFATFVIAFTPTAPLNPTNVVLGFTSTNTDPAATISGVNTLLLSASATPVPDIVALAATASNDGILHIAGTTGSNAFAVATVNVGASGQITATANTGAATLPLAISICQTNASTGQCLGTPGSSVTTTIGANATPTFGIFATASGVVPFLPATNRIFVQFSDATGVVRGSTSVAVETQ